MHRRISIPVRCCIGCNPINTISMLGNDAIFSLNVSFTIRRILFRSEAKRTCFFEMMIPYPRIVILNITTQRRGRFLFSFRYQYTAIATFETSFILSLTRVLYSVLHPRAMVVLSPFQKLKTYQALAIFTA